MDTENRYTNFFILSYVLFIVILLADAIYLLAQPGIRTGDVEGKLFDTLMYEKSSIFFIVTNGVNFTLFTKIPLVIFIVWGHLGIILGYLGSKSSLIDSDNPVFRWKLLPIFLLPVLTWDLLLLFERFKLENIGITIGVLLILTTIYVFSQMQVYDKFQNYTSLTRISQLLPKKVETIIHQVMIYLVAYVFVFLSYVD